MALSECILITGGASGIGRAWVCGFLEDGCTVVAADISKASLAQLEPHPRLHTFVCDVADAQQVKRMIEFAVSCMGRLDVLFNNAGMGYSTRVEDAKDNQFENHVAVHLFGCANGMRFAIPIMRKQGRGRIVNTISRDAESSRPRLSAYAAAKAGMWSLSRAAALEVADTDILVNMLFPGPTATGIFRRKIADDGTIPELPHLQTADKTYACARFLATLPKDGPTGKVFTPMANNGEYEMFKSGRDPLPQAIIRRREKYKSKL